MGTSLSPGSVGPERVLKRKVAIARFTNETKYGAGLFVDENRDRIGKQAADALASDLTKSGKFILLERQDLHQLQTESELMGLSREEFKANLVGVDALILGSVTELGRKTTGEQQLLQRSKKQTALARVNIRLVDPRTGHVFFSETGAGEAATAVVTTLGFGSQAEFDSTLTDKALSAAVADLTDKVISKLTDKPWSSAILSAEGDSIMISGGLHQGLKIGDRLRVIRPGRVVKSPQTGFNIELPGTPIGELEVVRFFGDSETNEGSVCRLVSGTVPLPSDIVQY